MAKTNQNNNKNFRKELTDFQRECLKRKAEMEAEDRAVAAAKEAKSTYHYLCEHNATFGELLDAYNKATKAAKVKAIYFHNH